MAEPAALEPELRNRLTRYLHTGNELPRYFPGCWTTHKYFEEDKLPVINQTMELHPGNVEVVNIIVKACKDGWYTRFETIAFALVKCVLHGNSAIKEAAYKASLQICDTPEKMLLFNKYTRLLKTGNGRGWCNSIKAWYISKDPMELVKEMTRVRARHGRSHKTLLRKSHVKINESDHECAAWEEPHRALISEEGSDLSLPAVVNSMVGSEESWDAVVSFCETVVSQRRLRKGKGRSHPAIGDFH